MAEAASSNSGFVHVNGRAMAVPVWDIVELAQHIQMADSTIKANTTDKLLNILERIRQLQAEAKQVMDEAARDAELHRAACGLLKRPGQPYHLYERADGTRVLSIVSPKEWCPDGFATQDVRVWVNSTPPGCPYALYLGSFRLEHNMHWTPLANTTRRDADVELVRPLVMHATAPDRRLEFRPDGGARPSTDEPSARATAPLLAIAQQIDAVEQLHN